MGFYYLIISLIAITGAVVQWLFKGKFSEFSKQPTQSGLSGKEVAEKMLQENNISDVQVVTASGISTDFYDPIKKTITLSSEVYNGRNIASAAIASHESGHAIQHNKGYLWLYLRNIVIPFINGVSAATPWLLLAGLLTIRVFPQVFAAGVILFVVCTIFCFLTLPVELDASKRAMGWLNKSGKGDGKDQALTKSALNWAALAYFMTAIASLSILLVYIITLINGHHSD